MHDARVWVNAIAIFAATSLVIFRFELSPLWYSAALLAWLIRRQWVYHAQGAEEGEDKAAVHPADRTAENL